MISTANLIFANVGIAHGTSCILHGLFKMSSSYAWHWINIFFHDFWVFCLPPLPLDIPLNIFSAAARVNMAQGIRVAGPRYDVPASKTICVMRTLIRIPNHVSTEVRSTPDCVFARSLANLSDICARESIGVFHKQV